VFGNLGGPLQQVFREPKRKDLHPKRSAPKSQSCTKGEAVSAEAFDFKDFDLAES
jgi:hypothetical protein